MTADTKTQQPGQAQTPPAPPSQKTEPGTQPQVPKPEPTQPHPPSPQPTTPAKSVSGQATYGIEKTLEIFDDLGVLSMASFLVYKKLKGGLNFWAIMGALGEVVKFAATVQETIDHVKVALPEIADIDKAEAEILGGKTQELVKKVVDMIKTS